LSANPRGYDKISIAGKAPYGVGTFKWRIVNQYKKKDAGDDTAQGYCTAIMSAESTAEGKCTIRKAGSGDFSKDAGDDSVTPAKW
jgi:hypothetical protein